MIFHSISFLLFIYSLVVLMMVEKDRKFNETKLFFHSSMCIYSFVLFFYSVVFSLSQILERKFHLLLNKKNQWTSFDQESLACSMVDHASHYNNSSLQLHSWNYFYWYKNPRLFREKILSLSSQLTLTSSALTWYYLDISM